MGKADHLMKVFFSNPQVFADVFNFWLYDGMQYIRPENLREVSGSLIHLTEENDEQDHDPKTSEHMRDVLMHLICMEDGDSVYALLGIEGQTHVDYAMAARALIYDARQYEKQLKEIRTLHNIKGEKGNSPGEFLWKFFKTDSLIPVVTVVVYLGPDAWDGPRTLHDMFRFTNPVLLQHGVNYKLNLIEPMQMSDVDTYKFHTDMREVMLYMKSSKDKQHLLHLAEEGKLRKVDRTTAYLINEISNSKLKIEKGTVKIDMCEAIKGIREDALKQGIEQGIEHGIEQGRKQIALNMASAGMSISVISQITEEAEETIQEWLLAGSTN